MVVQGGNDAVGNGHHFQMLALVVDLEPGSVGQFAASRVQDGVGRANVPLVDVGRVQVEVGLFVEQLERLESLVVLHNWSV